MVRRANIPGYVLFVYPVADARFIEFAYDFRTVPVFVKVEGKVRQPSL